MSRLYHKPSERGANDLAEAAETGLWLAPTFSQREGQSSCGDSLLVMAFHGALHN